VAGKTYTHGYLDLQVIDAGRRPIDKLIFDGTFYQSKNIVFLRRLVAGGKTNK